MKTKEIKVVKRGRPKGTPNKAKRMLKPAKERRAVYLLNRNDFDVLESLQIKLADNILDGRKELNKRNSLAMFSALDSVISNLKRDSAV